MNRCLRVVLLSLLVITMAAPRLAFGQAPAPYLSDPHFVAAMDEAKLMNRQHRFGFAVDAYRKANKLAGGSCTSCLQGEYHAQMSAGSYKDAASVADHLTAIASTPSERALAMFYRADALWLAAGEKPKAEKLQTIHALLAEVESLNPRFSAALYLDGQVLARLGQMEEAKTVFARCVACVPPGDPARLRAEHFAENPELSTHPMAPSFEVTALDGTRFNLDAMGGRVVLIDFWATWCPPCNAEIPHLQKVARQFAGEPLVMISVSVDKDEAKWKAFVAKHEMNWLQYRDADGKLGETFGVTTIPRYFTIDADGILTSVMVAEGSDIEGVLRKLLVKAHAAHPATTTAALTTVRDTTGEP